jgi:hypothetical protein
VSEDLIEEMIHFVREQLDEEERLAKVVADEEGSVWHAGDEFLSGTVGSDKANYILRAPYDGELSWEMRQYLADHDPARVLGEVKIFRLIIEVHDPSRAEYPEIGDCPVCISDQSRYPELWESDKAPCATLRLLAAIFDDRPGYREEWRPQ